MQTQQTSISSSLLLYSASVDGKRCQLGLSLLRPVGHPCLTSNSTKTRLLFNGCKLKAPAAAAAAAAAYGRSFSGVEFGRDGIFTRKKGKRAFLLGEANRGFGFNDGGGWNNKNNNNNNNNNNNSKRVLGNLAVAIGLTYLSMTGQLGWLLDAVVSIWVLVVLLPVIGLGVFLWFASRDMVQDSCPNCGNDFQIPKSSLKDGVEFCPFCTEPFSVMNNRFIRASTKFSSNSELSFERVFNGFPRGSKKERAASSTVVDIEAEVRDVD